VLDLTGATINALVIAGLAVAIGVVVDDAAGDVHDIQRRLEHAAAGAGGRPAAGAVLAASLQRRTAMGYATLVVLLVALPVFFLGGLDGAFLHPMALGYVLAVLASMVVALTVTPALSLMLAVRGPGRARGPGLGGALTRRHDRVLARFAASPRPALATAAVLAVAGLALIPFAGSALRPTFKDRDLLVRWDAAPSTSLPEMSRITARAESALRSVPGVRDVGAHVGRAVTGDQAVGTGSGELWVRMDPSADYDATLAAIRDVAGGFPGVRGRVLTYESERTTGVFGPADHALTVRVYGQDLGVLRREAGKVRGVVAGVGGVRDPRIELPAMEPTLRVQVDIADARRHGILPGDVRRAVATLVSGLEVGSFFEQQKVFAVVVRGVPATAHSIDSVRGLLLDAPGGRHVRLGAVARVRIAPAPVDIRHDSVSRFVDVRAAVRGRDIGAVQDDVRDRLRGLALPLEYHAQVVPESADLRSGRRLPSLIVAAALGVYLLLQAAFGSWRLAALAFVALPLAVVGGLLVAVLDGGELSLGELAGLFAVLAVAVRNVVALVRHVQFLEEQPQAGPPDETVLRAARERLVPVVMTAIATACAVLPFALLGDVAGNEITQPLAVVLLGGLVTSTLVSVLVVPSLVLHLRPAATPAPSPAEGRAAAPAPADLRT
jgi:Cu/Ag efflux pump CusA